MAFGEGATRLMIISYQWTVRDLGAAVAGLWHVEDKHGHKPNPFDGLVNPRARHVRSFRRVLHEANQIPDTMERLVFVARAMRTEESWPDEWRRIIPVYFMITVLGQEMFAPAAERVSEMLDSSWPAADVAGELNALMSQIPDQLTR